MLPRFLFTLFTALPLFAAQSFVYSSSTGSFTIPNREPFISMRETRLEFRIHDFTITNGAVLLRVPNTAWLVVFFRGSTELCVDNLRGDDMRNYGGIACVDVAGRTDVVIRIQRVVTTWPAGELRIETWNTAGGGYTPGYCWVPGNKFPCPILSIVGTDWHGTGDLGGSPMAAARMAWLKWHSSAVPFNSAPPKSTDAGSLGDWSFEGDTRDSGPFAMHITVGNATYATTPTYPPACVIAAPALTAGASSTLDGRGSYPLDGGSALSYLWQQLNGQSTAEIRSRDTATPSVSGLIYGPYTFQLTVTDGSGQRATCTVKSTAKMHAAYTVVDAGRPATAIVNYNSGNLPSNIRPQVMKWETDRFKYLIQGTVNMTAYNPDVIWPGYVNHLYRYPDGMYDVRDSGASHGFNYEDALNHIKVDYTSANNLGWRQMDQFDTFEKTAVGGTYLNAVNGVFLLDGTVYTDKTVAAYDQTAGDVSITDKLLLGYMEPFAEINFVLTTPASGVSVAWQYWDGSTWKTLALASDGTGGLSQSGKITFTPPADWAIKAENGLKQKYWVRAVVTGAGAKPVASRIYGDDWLRGGDSTQCRGWSYTDPGRVNVGRGNLEYNPAAPAEASAKFRYQARAAGGFWSYNGVMGNPANIQNGKRTWAQFLVDQAVAAVTKYGYNGIMFDDATGPPKIASPPDAATTQSDWSGTSYLDDQIAQLQQEAADLHALYGDQFKVGSNSQVMLFIYGTDFSLIEPHNFAQYIGNTRYTVQPDLTSDWKSTSFDGFLAADNPSGTKALMMTLDNAYNGVEIFGTYHLWDRGNRGPMTALAGYYIGANPNTAFSYNSLGYIYYDTGNFYYYSEPATLTSSIAADTSGAIKNIDGDFSAYSGTGSTAGGCGYAPLIALGPIGNQEYVCATKISDTRFQTTSPIRNSYAAEAPVWQVSEGHQAIDPIPPISYIYRWGAWFPAMGVDIGSPDPNGWNGGARDMQWKTGSSMTTLADATCGSPRFVCAPVWRRDYTGAVVLVRSYENDATNPDELEAPSKPIDLGGAYYPLMADGNTGAGITSLTLRAGEAAILMKAPRSPARTVSVGFEPDSVPNAASVRVTLRRPDGGSVSKTCSTSPCQIDVNPTMGQHLQRLDYLSASGTVLASSSREIVVK
jgi:hypothetical protein